MKIGWDSKTDRYFICDLTEDESLVALVVASLCQITLAQAVAPEGVEIGKRILEKKGKLLTIKTTYRIADCLARANEFKQNLKKKE